jgi:hypothetical protein
MHRHLRTLCACVVVAGALLAVVSDALPASPSLTPAAGDIPGVPLTSSPVQGYLTGTSGAIDVYSIQAHWWDRLSLTLTGDVSLFGAPAEPVGMAVYGPDATGVSSSVPFASATGLSFPVKLTYLHLPSGSTSFPPTGGAYSIAVFAEHPDAFGSYSLAWTCKSWVLIYAGPSSSTIRRGGSARIAGAVKYAGDGAPIPLHKVVLVRLKTGGGWVEIQDRTTDASGGYAFVIRPQRTGYYRVMSPETPSLLRKLSSPRLRIIVRR